MHILNNWKVLKVAAPDGKSLICIEGRVYGSNPRFPHSALIRTSSVTCYQREASSMVIITSRGSEYLLGRPDPSEPHAEQVLVDCLPQKVEAVAARYDGLRTQVISHVPDNADETVMVKEPDARSGAKT